MLHTLIRIDNRYSALMDLQWFRGINRNARKFGVAPYSRKEVREILVSRYGWN